MIINEVTARKEYIGNNATVLFPYDFGIVNGSDLEVLVDGVVQTYNSAYSVTGAGAAAGGNVVFVVAPIQDAEVVITRKQPLEQQSDYQPNEEFPAERIENDLAKLAAVAQMFSEMFNRTLKLEKKSLLAPLEAELVEPTAIDTFLRVSSLSPLAFNWATLQTLAGAIAIPVSRANGGTGIAAASKQEVRDEIELQPALKGTDVVAAAALPIGAGNYFSVTGNTTITSIAAKPSGTLLALKFVDSPIMTHTASLALMGTVNAQMTPGDLMLLIAEAGGVWRELTRRPLTNANAGRVFLGNGTWGGVAVPRGYGWGCELSNGPVDTVNDITIIPGAFASDDLLDINRVLLNAGQLVKQLDAVWAAGTNAGGRISTHALADGTWHIFLFRRSNGVDDICFSNTLSPTLPDGGTKKRRIGSIVRAGATIIQFVHQSDLGIFHLMTPLLDLDSTAPGTATITVTPANVPSGIVLQIITNIWGLAGTAVFGVLVGSTVAGGPVPSLTAAPGVNLAIHPVTTGYDAGQFKIPTTTNTFHVRCTASGAANRLWASVIGYIDDLDRTGRL